MKIDGAYHEILFRSHHLTTYDPLHIAGTLFTIQEDFALSTGNSGVLVELLCRKYAQLHHSSDQSTCVLEHNIRDVVAISDQLL